MGDVTTNAPGGAPLRAIRTAPIAARPTSPLSKKVLVNYPLFAQFSRRFNLGL